jgi:hypothetical protein
MRFWLLTLLTFNFSFLVISCGLDIEDPTAPSPPQWVQKSLPEVWPERGVDAYEGGGIFLEWEPVTNENIVTYMIYRAELFNRKDSLGDYAILAIIETQSNTTLEYLDTEALREVKYFYKLRSEDNTENRSDYSDSVGYSLLQEPPLHEMRPNGIQIRLNLERQLRWRFVFSHESEYYCLTILTASNELVLREKLIPGNYLGSPETWVIPDTILLIYNQIYKWRIDASANYVDDLETAGSESPWATFFYAED